VVSVVNRRLTQNDLVDMNAEVTGGKSDEEVARRFLSDTGLADPIRLGND
jgi:glycine betaine/choline ABC-type transport system substrate-binding protein